MSKQLMRYQGGYKGYGEQDKIPGLTQDASNRFKAAQQAAARQNRQLSPMESLNAIDPSGSRAAEYENMQYLRRKAYRQEEAEELALRRNKLAAAKEQMEYEDEQRQRPRRYNG